MSTRSASTDTGAARRIGRTYLVAFLLGWLVVGLAGATVRLELWTPDRDLMGSLERSATLLRLHGQLAGALTFFVLPLVGGYLLLGRDDELRGGLGPFGWLAAWAFGLGLAAVAVLTFFMPSGWVLRSTPTFELQNWIWLLVLAGVLVGLVDVAVRWIANARLLSAEGLVVSVSLVVAGWALYVAVGGYALTPWSRHDVLAGYDPFSLAGWESLGRVRDLLLAVGVMGAVAGLAVLVTPERAAGARVLGVMMVIGVGGGIWAWERLGELGLDVHLFDTTFGVAPLHAFTGAIWLGLMALLWPRRRVRRKDAVLGVAMAVLAGLGYLTFVGGLLLLGSEGLPRRYDVYPDRFTTWQRIVTAGAVAWLVGMGWFCIDTGGDPASLVATSTKTPACSVRRAADPHSSAR